MDNTLDDIDRTMEDDVSNALDHGASTEAACKLAWLAGARWGVESTTDTVQTSMIDTLAALGVPAP